LDGKLDAYASLTDGERATGALPEPPTVMLVASRVGDEIVFEAMATGDALEYRFDLDYDGVFDSEWGAQSDASVSADDAASADRTARWAKVVVRDRVGQQAGALARYPGEDNMPSADMGGGDVDMGDGGPRTSRCLCRAVCAPPSEQGRLALFIAALLLGLRSRTRRGAKSK
jgi:hypothetical protein